MITYLSQLFIPLLVFLIVGYGFVSRKEVFQSFIKGAEEGIALVVRLAPIMIGLFVAVGVLRDSGLMAILTKGLSVPLQYVTGGTQLAALLPLLVVRLFSASAANGLLVDLYQTYGVDSPVAYGASIIMCCTETFFYTMSVYYMSVKIRRTRWTVPGCLAAITAGVVTSLLIADII